MSIWPTIMQLIKHKFLPKPCTESGSHELKETFCTHWSYKSDIIISHSWSLIVCFNTEYDCLIRDKVAACAKHFVGDGGTQKGINENNTILNRPGLLSIHMPAYYSAIAKGVSTIMVSYSSWNGVKMHANHDMITGFLKNTLHFKVSNIWISVMRIIFNFYITQWLLYCWNLFQGFVISDWQGIDRITSPPGSNYSYSVQAGVNAGIDMVSIFSTCNIVR